MPIKNRRTNAQAQPNRHAVILKTEEVNYSRRSAIDEVYHDGSCYSHTLIRHLGIWYPVDHPPEAAPSPPNFLVLCPH